MVENDVCSMKSIKYFVLCVVGWWLCIGEERYYGMKILKWMVLFLYRLILYLFLNRFNDIVFFYF